MNLNKKPAGVFLINKKLKSTGRNIPDQNELPEKENWYWNDKTKQLIISVFDRKETSTIHISD